MGIYLWIIAVFIAFFVKGICGFANTLIFSSIMSFGTNNINISPVDLIIGIPPNGIMVWKNRKKINYKIWLPLSVLVVLGVVPGVIFLKNTDVTVVKLIFGFLLIIISIQMFIQDKFLKNKADKKQNKILIIILGLISGVTCGLFGVGAMLAAYVNSVAEDVESFKANMCIVFLIENLVRFGFYTAYGILTIESYKTAGILFLPMLIGLISGMLVGKKLNEKTVKLIVVIMLILSGISLIVKSLI